MMPGKTIPFHQKRLKQEVHKLMQLPSRPVSLLSLLQAKPTPVASATTQTPQSSQPTVSTRGLEAIRGLVVVY